MTDNFDEIQDQENNEDFEKFMKKYGDKDIVEDIKFSPINNISEALGSAP